MSLLNSLIDWENGNLNYEQEIELFQYLVDTGIAWKLQGSYGRYAKGLIESGEVRPPVGTYQRGAA